MPRTGQLFEAFVWEFGSDRCRKILSEAADGEVDQKVSDVDTSQLIRANADFFMMSSLQAMSHLGRLANKQLFFFTLVMRFRGASIAATELLSHFNINLAKSTYRRHLAEYLHKQRTVIK